MQTELEALATIEQRLDKMAHDAKTTLFPQIARIMGNSIACDYQNGRRVVFEFDGIVITRKRLAAFILSNAK